MTKTSQLIAEGVSVTLISGVIEVIVRGFKVEAVIRFKENDFPIGLTGALNEIDRLVDANLLYQEK